MFPRRLAENPPLPIINPKHTTTEIASAAPDRERTNAGLGRPKLEQAAHAELRTIHRSQEASQRNRG